MVQSFLLREKNGFYQTDNREQYGQHQDGVLGIGIQKTTVIGIEKVEAREAPDKEGVGQKPN